MPELTPPPMTASEIKIKKIINPNPGEKLSYLEILNACPDFRGRRTTYQWVKCQYCGGERLVPSTANPSKHRAHRDCHTNHQKKTYHIGRSIYGTRE
jgi:hypothetical protein